MFIEVQATYLVLKRWNQNPAATRRQIGIWQHWKQETEDNDRPLSEVEVERMNAFLKQNARPATSRYYRNRKETSEGRWSGRIAHSRVRS